MLASGDWEMTGRFIGSEAQLGQHHLFVPAGHDGRVDEPARRHDLAELRPLV
ncbi:MAG: hypothetical protein V9G29_02910 [Burkholderiaceae bacterium]